MEAPTRLLSFPLERCGPSLASCLRVDLPPGRGVVADSDDLLAAQLSLSLSPSLSPLSLALEPFLVPDNDVREELSVRLCNAC